MSSYIGQLAQTFGRFFLVGCICFAVVKNVCASNPGDTDLLQKLRAQWDHQRASVQSAVIEYRYVHRLATPNTSHEDVLRLLGNVDLVGSDEACRSLIGALDSTLLGQVDCWGSNVFTFDNENGRVDSTYRDKTTSHVVANGSDVYRIPATADGAYQVDIIDRDSSTHGMSKITDFNKIPRPAFIENAKIVAREVRFAAGRVTIKNAMEEVTVNENSGFVYEYRLGLPSMRQFQEIFQYAPTSYPGDVLFPSIILSTKYRNGKLSKFSMLMIDKVSINPEISDDTFTVSANPNDIYVDRRNQEKIVKDLNRPVENVVNLPPEILRPIGALESTHHGRKWIIFLNIGIILVLIIVIAVRRWRRAHAL